MSVDVPQVAVPEQEAIVAKPGLRLVPAIAIVILQWTVMTVPGWVAPGTFASFMSLMWGAMIGSLVYVLWWLFFSRVAWRERLLLLAALVLEAAAAYFLDDKSVRIVFMIRMIPIVLVAVTVGLALTARRAWSTRLVTAALIAIPVWAYYGLLRLEGIDGAMNTTYSWRWSPTSEEVFLKTAPAVAKAAPSASQSETVTEVASAPLELRAGDYPEFRGPNRDGIVPGETIETNWEQHPPKLVWKQRIGPGWSSFILVDNHLFTQEQRGENEAVVCYRPDTGEQIWVHEDHARFWEVLGGAGPRATPTFHEGRLYCMGANGLVNCLDASTGKVIWSRDLVKDSGAKVPQWGFSSSPLVLQGIVSVFAGGEPGKSVVAYRIADGELAWTAGEGKASYSSPQTAMLDGAEQVLVASDHGLLAFAPTDGKLLWEHIWPFEGMARIVQPHIMQDGTVLLGTGYGNGTRQLKLEHKDEAWKAVEGWTSKDLKPYFNDYVSHAGFLYGFDGQILTCLDAATGKRVWKGGRYGHGQLILLTEQDLLVILSETGEAALVQAAPEKYGELAKFQAIDGKTWNNPVIAHGKMYMRNAEEAACYQVGPSVESGK